MYSTSELPETLPRGPHKLPAEVVRASQRQRLLDAMLELVGEHGLEATTVPMVVARARVGRNSFYALFDDKMDCFIALCERLSVEVLEQLAIFDEPVWTDALRVGAGRYLAWWQARPNVTQAYLVELPQAGRRATDARAQFQARFHVVFETVAAWAREQQAGLPPLRPVTVSFLVPALEELVAHTVRAGDIAGIPALEDDIVYLTAKLLADEASAAAAVA